MMTSTRPYLIRAFYDWIVDNRYTPHFLVDATIPGVEVPQEYVENGQILLNIAPAAVHGLHLGNTAISFQARFGGVIHRVYLPVSAVMAVFAKENGRGMVFAEEPEHQAVTAPEEDPETGESSSGGGGKAGRGGKPHLTLVK